MEMCFYGGADLFFA